MFYADSIQNIYSRIQSSETEFGAKIRKQIAALSPLSMAVVFEQIKRGHSLNLKEAFEMEYKIADGYVHHTEFFEGVRALLIDKDKNPKWMHKSVLDVKKEDVDFFFDRKAQLSFDLNQFKE